MYKSKKIAEVSALCVACGTCMNECPLNAITINYGIKAKIDLNNCVGCGKCSKVCPASVIAIVDREVKYEK
ncbi:MAG: 4Fe-4S dicluster domain-containing protein [Lachnospiraceae bacterium]